jgi:3-hydroxyacyl-[acyl-carrier protein] dehydratase/trans-2-decenoyl-[acyl-carrier protein] isomerase
LKTVIRRKLILGVADGIVKVDGRSIYQTEGLRVGLFTSTVAI